MSKNLNRAAATKARKKRNRTALLWVAGAAVLVIALLVTEQVALLYILSTLAVCVLLIMVAFADLRGARQATAQAAPLDDSAAIGDRTAKPIPASASAARPAAGRGRRER